MVVGKGRQCEQDTTAAALAHNAGMVAGEYLGKLFAQLEGSHG